MKISKGHNSMKNDGVMVLVFCTLSDNALYLYQVSGNIYLRVSEFLSRHNFHSEICKVASFQKKKIDGLQFVISAHHLIRDQG